MTDRLGLAGEFGWAFARARPRRPEQLSCDTTNGERDEGTSALRFASKGACCLELREFRRRGGLDDDDWVLAACEGKRRLATTGRSNCTENSSSPQLRANNPHDVHRIKSRAKTLIVHPCRWKVKDNGTE